MLQPIGVVLRSGIVPRRSTLNLRRKGRWTVTTESLFLKKVVRQQTHDALRSNAHMATEIALSLLPAGSRRRSLTPPLPSTSHLKKHTFPLLHLQYNSDFIVKYFASYSVEHVAWRPAILSCFMDLFSSSKCAVDAANV
jgi:hypothetical protein